MAVRFMSTKEAAGCVGVHPQTLRNWERAGVVPPALRRRGLRVYTLEDVERIRSAVFVTAEMREEGGANRAERN
jgi:DNA-binding transcriptional MerR regulator